MNGPSADSTNEDECQRRGHAVLDLQSRELKAIKIAKLIGAELGQPSRRMLEVGTGSGGIAHYFGRSGAMGWDVEAVDVEDVRLATDGYSFTRVDGVHLPFEDDSFDVVLSNHVIEHVGDRGQQATHLAELRRVLRPGGVGYLAVPCRWMLVEPHFKLPFLSWMPMGMSHVYVRLASKGTHYDCRPLTCGQLEPMLGAAGFAWRQHTGDALRTTFEIEQPDAPLYRHILRYLTDATYKAMRRIFPTLIYTLSLREADSSTASSDRALSAHVGSAG